MNNNPIPLKVGYHWQHPLPNDLWPQHYGGFRTAEDYAVALEVINCADAWRRNDPAAIAHILRASADVQRIATQAVYFTSEHIRQDPNPPAIANWLREKARQDHRMRLRMAQMMGTDWDDGGTAEQHMLAELDIITFAELVAADDEAGVIRFIGSGGIDRTPVFGSASCGTKVLARVWPPEIYEQMRKTFGGKR